jgi:hypothetical protein
VRVLRRPARYGPHRHAAEHVFGVHYLLHSSLDITDPDFATSCRRFPLSRPFVHSGSGMPHPALRAARWKFSLHEDQSLLHPYS